MAQGRGSEAQRLAEGVREGALPGGRHVSTTLAKFGQNVLLVLDADVVALLSEGCHSGPLGLGRLLRVVPSSALSYYSSNDYDARYGVIH